MEWQGELLVFVYVGRSVGRLDAAALHDDATVVIHGSVIEQYILRVHLCSQYLCQLLALAVEHLGLEPLVHAVHGPLCVCVEVKVPIIDAGNMYAISVQFNHIQVVTTVLVALLILDDDEERIWGYGVGSAHWGAKIAATSVDQSVAVKYSVERVSDRSVRG